MKVVTISSKRQITLPKKGLEPLGVGPKSKLTVQIQDQGILLKPLEGSLVDQVAGSLTNYVPVSKRGVSFQTVYKETKRITARKIAKGR